jgi:hypothetical protein
MIIRPEPTDSRIIIQTPEYHFDAVSFETINDIASLLGSQIISIRKELYLGRGLEPEREVYLSITVEKELAWMGARAQPLDPLIDLGVRNG